MAKRQGNFPILLAAYVIAKFISRMLLWSLLTVVHNKFCQLSRLQVSLKFKWINQVMKPSFFEVDIRRIFHWEALDPGQFASLISLTPGGNCQLTIPRVLPQEEADDMCDSEQRLLSHISHFFVCLAIFCLSRTFLAQVLTITKLKRRSANRTLDLKDILPGPQRMKRKVPRQGRIQDFF